MRGLRPISHSFNGGWQPLRQGRGLQEGRNQLASAPAAHVPRQAWRKPGSILEATPVRMGNARQIVKSAHNEFGRAWLPSGRDRATLCKGVLFMTQDMISVETSDHQIEIPKEALPLWEAIETLPDMVCVSAERGKDPVGMSSITIGFDCEGGGITTTADYQHVAAMLADIASRLTADGDVDAEVTLNFSHPPACNIECLVIDVERAATIVLGSVA